MKKDLLKTPEVMHDFIYRWIHMMGMGEKPRNIYKNKETKEKSPVWLPSHPPVYKIGGRLFSGEYSGQHECLSASTIYGQNWE